MIKHLSTKRQVCIRKKPSYWFSKQFDTLRTISRNWKQNYQSLDRETGNHFHGNTRILLYTTQINKQENKRQSSADILNILYRLTTLQRHMEVYAGLQHCDGKSSCQPDQSCYHLGNIPPRVCFGSSLAEEEDPLVATISGAVVSSWIKSGEGQCRLWFLTVDTGLLATIAFPSMRLYYLKP